jgi:hypothetical protein
MVVIVNDKPKQMDMESIMTYFKSQLVISVSELKQLTQNLQVPCFLAQSGCMQMQVIRYSFTNPLSPFESTDENCEIVK